MNQDLQNLIALAAADQEIARLSAEIAELPRRVAAIEQKLARTRAQVEAAKKAIADDQAEKRKQESLIQDQQQKISKYREQSLAVKTNEQYKALMHEIEFAEAEIRKAEDRILELMVDAEEREKTLKAAEAEMKEEMAEIEHEKVEARERTAADEAQLKQWGGQRDTLRGAVSESYLLHYDRVAKQRKNAISGARDQKCLACHVMLRPQTYNELLAGEKLITCDSCGRILFYEPAAEAVPARA